MWLVYHHPLVEIVELLLGADGVSVGLVPGTAVRSRYGAFAVGDTAYLMRSWHSTTRPADLTLDPGQQRTHLEIHETSRFVRELGHWIYLDGGQT